MSEELNGKNIDMNHLMKVCKYRKGEQCCKYIVYFENQDDYYCVKNVPDLRNKINRANMEAKGDNCEGL